MTAKSRLDASLLLIIGADSTRATVKRAAIAFCVLAAASIISAVEQPARAGAIVPCYEPFVFSGSPVNVFTVEYISPAYDRPDRPTQSESERDLKRTAQQLTWLIKLDAFLTARYSGLAVITALEEGRPGACTPDRLIEALMRLRGGTAPQPGQALLFLYGRIYQEEQEIYLQSYLRRVRLESAKLAPVPERLSLTLKDDRGETVGLSAAIPDDIVVFPPRQLLVSDLRRITELFTKSGRVYDARDTASPSHILRFNPEQATAFAVEEIDASGWIRIRPHVAADDLRPGWVKVDPEAGKLLHQRMPELDFMSGEIGYLRIRQTYDAPQFKSYESRAALTAAMRDAFARYDAGARENSREAAARAAAWSMSGVASAVQAEVGQAVLWRDASDRFLAAGRADPSDVRARNLLALAQIALCCQGSLHEETAEAALGTQLGVLSIRPNDRDALANLDDFYWYLLGRAGAAGLSLSREEIQSRRSWVVEIRRVLGQ